MRHTSSSDTRPTVLLFDVDGTLLSSGGAGRLAMERAFGRLHGRADACAGFRMDGMTDRAIVRRGLAAIGAPSEHADIDAVIATYLAELRETVAAAAAQDYHAHPGVETIVARALALGCAVGLGTGNVRAGAHVKLERLRLHEHFAFGGFGCDHELRPEVIRIGASRGAAALGLLVSECRVVVIGDTPSDVAAARAIGAECVGVGTGFYTPEQLIACGATRAFAHLEAAGALEAILLGD